MAPHEQKRTGLARRVGVVWGGNATHSPLKEIIKQPKQAISEQPPTPSSYIMLSRKKCPLSVLFQYPLFIPNWPTQSGPETLAKVHKQLDTLDDVFLKDSDYLAGDSLTLADLSVCASVTLLDSIDFDLSRWARVSAWLGRLRALPYFDECNKEGLDGMRKLVEAKKKLMGD